MDTIRSEWGQAVAALCMRAWESREWSQCPTFGEWMIELAKLEAEATPRSYPETVPKSSSDRDELLKRAKRYEEKGKYKEAIDLYRDILKRDSNASLAKEIEIAIAGLEQKLDTKIENQRQRIKRRVSRIKRTAVAVILAGLLGYGGYHAYEWLRHYDFGAGRKAETASVAELNLKIQSLEADVADKKKTIEQLTKRLEELGKPMEVRNEEMLMQLSQDFDQIRRAAALTPNSRTDPSQLTFDAAQTFMDHWYTYLLESYLLDDYFTEQLKIVEGYYYPFLYNHNRNAQLNIRFFQDYKNHFTGGTMP